MNNPSHSASRIIIATPRAIFRAFVDPEVLVKWRAPAGTVAELLAFDPRLGGGYKMVLREQDGAGQEKASADSAVLLARFLALEAEERIVEAVTFESAGPASAATMTLTISLKPVTGGTKVTVLVEDVAVGIDATEHLACIEAALKKLANLLE
jgi:uncharacterized protein YndB with AHSA1/START domain